MRAEIRRLQRDLGVTMLYVTHDQVEAMTLGDRVAVFRGGELQQVAKPGELYGQPVNTFVAAFIGSPSMNFLTVTLNESHGTLLAASGSETFELGPQVVRDHPGLAGYLGRAVLLGVRPEDLHLTGSVPADRAIRARVELVEVLGSEVLVHASTAALAPGAAPGQDGPAGSAGAPLIARSDVRAEPAPGQEIGLRPDPANVRFFDPASGEAV
jgi:multiple sugar transport system ATP-binding protein